MKLARHPGAILNIFKLLKTTIYALYIYLHKLTIASYFFGARIISFQSGNCLHHVAQKF